jgi:hypothetical protein
MVIMQAARVIMIAAVTAILATIAIVGTASAEVYQFHLKASETSCYEFPFINANVRSVSITAQDISPESEVAILVLFNDKIMDSRTVHNGDSYPVEIKPPSPGILKLIMSHNNNVPVTVSLEIDVYA